MKFIWMIVIAVMIAGCAPSNLNRMNGPSEAYVDLKPYAFDGRFVAYESPKALLLKINELGGAQKEFETNSEFSSRISGVGLSAVLSEVKDYQIKFDKNSGSLRFESSMEDAQGFGFRPNGEPFSDFKSAYYSVGLPDVERVKGEFLGQNAFGATAKIDQVESDRIYIVSPKIPKDSLRTMFVSMVSDLNISASDFKLQKNDLRLAIIFEPVPNFVQVKSFYGSATISNKRETTVNNYFLSAKLAGVSIVNIKTKQIVSSGFRVKFKAL